MRDGFETLSSWRVAEHFIADYLQVMFWIYGGSFQDGTERLYDGSALAGLHDVVVVIPNYRLNVFGFLSLGKDSCCPGNAGLWDQNMALQYVLSNAHRLTNIFWKYFMLHYQCRLGLPDKKCDFSDLVHPLSLLLYRFSKARSFWFDSLVVLIIIGDTFLLPISGICICTTVSFLAYGQLVTRRYSL